MKITKHKSSRTQIASDSAAKNRIEIEARFLELENRLLDQVLNETEVVSLRRLFKQASSEAAALAWSTPFPLLFFPALFAEKTHELRLQGKLQQSVQARSEDLVEQVL